MNLPSQVTLTSGPSFLKLKLEKMSSPTYNIQASIGYFLNSQYYDLCWYTSEDDHKHKLWHAHMDADYDYKEYACNTWDNTPTRKVFCIPVF